MSEELLDLVKCCPIVDERAGKAVAQIVEFCEVLGAFLMPRDFNGCHFYGGVTVRAVS